MKELDKAIINNDIKHILFLLKEGIDILYDDRDSKTAGEKFAESDLLGIPYRVVISEKTLEKNCVEMKERAKSKARLVKIKDLNKLFNAKGL